MSGISSVLRLLIPAPVPFTPVSIYALKTQSGYYLIDAGVATDDARKLVKAWLPVPLAGILITHSHADHMGLARELAQDQGCPLYLASHEIQRLKDPEGPRRDYGQVLTSAGVPETELAQVMEALKEIRNVDETAVHDLEIRELLPGQRFATELGELEVLHTPGHSAGHCCFYLPDQKLLFSGDHILSDISPNPVIDMGAHGKRRKAFVEYMESLKTVVSLPIKWILPGHGEPFNNLEEILERFHSFRKLREQSILQVIKGEPQTPYQIAKKIYPAIEGIDLLLGISKTWGQTDLLVAEGKVLELEENGVNFYIKSF